MSSPMITPSRKRNYLEYCIEGWIDDQGDGEKSGAETMDSSAEPPRQRSTSPAKRQRTVDTTSTSRWTARLDNDDSSNLREPSSATSASRASSPTKSVRTRRAQLDFTIPAIYFGPPRQDLDCNEDNSDSSDYPSQGDWSPEHNTPMHPHPNSTTNPEHPIPSEVCDLIRRFAEEAQEVDLPVDIISSIRKISPDSTLQSTAGEGASTTNSARRLFKHVSILYSMANDLYSQSHDESAWYPLVRRILMGPPGTSTHPFVKHEEAHTKLVCQELLPQRDGKHIPTVKVDHMLQFNTACREISQLYKPIFQSQPSSFSLSAFNDPIASKTFTCAIVEVKAPSGNFQEASYQIAVASAAILKRISLLGGDTSQETIKHDFMPVVGWVVHGHFWTLHISYTEADGSIRVLGPYPSGNTATFRGIYCLLRIVQDVKTWGRYAYFPYLSSKLSSWQ